MRLMVQPQGGEGRLPEIFGCRQAFIEAVHQPRKCTLFNNVHGPLQIVCVRRPDKPAPIGQQVGLWIAHLMRMLFKQVR
jgi:hypothetical protein